MTGTGIILIIIVNICLLGIGVGIVRWAFGIDKIISNQEKQLEFITEIYRELLAKKQ